MVSWYMLTSFKVLFSTWIWCLVKNTRKMKHCILLKYTYTHGCCCLWNFNCEWYFPCVATCMEKPSCYAILNQGYLYCNSNTCSLSITAKTETEALEQETPCLEIYHLLQLSSTAVGSQSVPRLFICPHFHIAHAHIRQQLLHNLPKYPLATAGVSPGVGYTYHWNVAHMWFFKYMGEMLHTIEVPKLQIQRKIQKNPSEKTFTRILRTVYKDELRSHKRYTMWHSLLNKTSILPDLFGILIYLCSTDDFLPLLVC